MLFFRKITWFETKLLSLFINIDSMRKLVENFPKQLLEAIEIGNNANLEKTNRTFSNVIVCGMGGSGIAGSIFQQLMRNHLDVPFMVNSQYDLPKWVTSSTLVIISSYSGNTEEALSCMNSAVDLNAEVAMITSGGKVLKFAIENGKKVIQIPGDMPPRSCLGYSLVQFHYLCHSYGLVTSDQIKKIEKAAIFLTSRSERIEKSAFDIAKNLTGKISVIFSSQVFEPISIRFRQQINENSKALAWSNVVPEMNHNAIVGWTERNDQLAVVSILDEDDNDRVKYRLDYVRSVVEPLVSSYTIVNPIGASILEKYFYLIHLFDWVSVQIAEEKGIDPVEVDVITRLKNQLAEF